MLNAESGPPAVIWVNVFSYGLGSFLIRAGGVPDKSVALWSLAAALKPRGPGPCLETAVLPQSYFLQEQSVSLYASCFLTHLSPATLFFFFVSSKPSGSLQPTELWLLIHNLCYWAGKGEKAALTFECGRFTHASAVRGMDTWRPAC